MNLYKEAEKLAQEAWEESEHDFDGAMDCLRQSCDSHEVAIYYNRAIDFCAEHDTYAGEEYLEDCGGIVQEGDTFGSIACRIAFATLLVKSQEVLQELQEESEQ